MKVELQNYVHSSNGLALQIIPETEIEAALLEAFWKHGKMERGYPDHYLIQAFSTLPPEAKP